ncbi:hypothetical protein [Bowmanella sp. JS7-9]|uniref:hypothetical protein n=1 Tax=Alteromonadaceae TaxID=72275 RepID=UPI00269CDF48
MKIRHHAKLPIFAVLALLSVFPSQAGTLEQAKRMHDRLAGVPADNATLQQMADLIELGDTQQAAQIAMQNPAFYRTTLKNWITPWTNEDADIFQPLNDYSATVIGMIRDDVDFRLILSGDILYTGASNLNLPAYSGNNNAHYEALEERQLDLQTALVRQTQSAITGLPAEATAGIMTSRAAAKAYFSDGTNRAMFRFTLINHLCTDLEALKDTSRVPDRVRQDVSRSPGGDSRIYLNSCVGCHAGMDPLAQSFAYYNYQYSDNIDTGQLQYSANAVQAKYLINANNFIHGFITPDDSWRNYWREGKNASLGWSNALPGTGKGAKSMGEELANSTAFASCQVKKVFENVCLRKPQDAADRSQIDAMTQNFSANGYALKDVFADAAGYCMGD